MIKTLFIPLLILALDALAARPNIIIYLADDMGYGDPQVYNQASKIPTPKINQLAKEGMLFLDGHSSNAVCRSTNCNWWWNITRCLC